MVRYELRRFLKVRWILLLMLLVFLLILQIPGFAGDKKEMIKEKVSDAWITAKVKAALWNDKRIMSRYIGIHTEEGVVTLSGAVKSQEEKDLILSTVTSIKGVTGVRDILLIYKELGEDCSHLRYSDHLKDALITAKVRTILTVDKIESLRTLSVVNVDTCNGVVLVVGKVRSEREKEMAIKLVEKIEDVVKVIDLISILPVEI